MSASKTTILSNEDSELIVVELKEIKAQIKKLQKIEKILKQKLYNYMGEYDVLVSPETGEEIVHWTYSKGYMKFDDKRFAAEKPKIYEKYCYMTDPVRTLNLK